MTERERLEEILLKMPIYEFVRYDEASSDTVYDIKKLADYLLNNGVIVPPYKVVWFIENRYTERQRVTGVSIENLPLNIVRNLDKYRYYATKEEAIKALKDCEK